MHSGDPVTTDLKGEVPREAATPPAVAGHNTPALVTTTDTYGGPLDPRFVTGLTEGEGCFCVSFAVRAKLRTGLEVRPSYSLSLNERDRALLQRLQTFFECGWLRESRGDRTVKYEVRSHIELVERIVPHFEDFPLQGSKAKSFQGFSRVCKMVWQGDHLTRSGLREIVAIAYESSLGKRRLAQADLLRVLDEVKG